MEADPPGGRVLVAWHECLGELLERVGLESADGVGTEHVASWMFVVVSGDQPSQTSRRVSRVICPFSRSKAAEHVTLAPSG